MTAMTCLIVDDEPLARVQLRALLEDEPEVTVVGEAGTKQEALEAIVTLRPQLVFLDIQMRGGGGFEILASLELPPAAVFVTAYDEHAIRAFEVNALDYLLKPVAPARLRASLDRFRGGRAAAAPSLRLDNGDRALLALGGSGHFVAVRDILWIEAADHYSRVITEGGRAYLIRDRFSDWSGRLPLETFAKIDRGLIVNTARIVAVIAAEGSAEIHLGSNATPLRVGASAAKRLRMLLPPG